MTQAQADIRNKHLATQILEKQFGQFSSAQNSSPQRGLLSDTNPNSKQNTALSTHIGLQLEELYPMKNVIKVVCRDDESTEVNPITRNKSHLRKKCNQ